MKDDFIDLKVTKKNLPLRIALFVVAFGCAIYFITKGVTSIGAMEEGYREIECSMGEDEILYYPGIHFSYYLEGDSAEIKSTYSTLTTTYSAILKKYYKMLDADTIYNDCNNIASINKNRGSFVEVDKELYDILLDACYKTEEKKNFNVFAGALYEEWDSILILENPEDFDPVRNPDEKERIKKMAAVTGNLDYFELLFQEKNGSYQICLNVSEEYKNLEKELELSSPVLHLGNLKEAYMLNEVNKELISLGYKKGFVVTDSGLSYLLPNNPELSYVFYSWDNEKAIPLEEITASGNSVFAGFMAFDTENDYCYRISEGDKSLYRHRYYDISTGEFSNLLASSAVINTNLNPVEAVYQNLYLNQLKTKEEIQAFVNKDTYYSFWENQ